MGGLLAARYDSAGIFFSGRRGPALLDCQPPGEGRNVRQDVLARAVAVAGAGRAGRVPAVDAQHPDELHVRRYAFADRVRLSDFVSAGVPKAAMAVDHARDAADGLLAGVGALPGAGRGIQLAGG